MTATTQQTAMIQQAAQAYGADPSVLYYIAQDESNFNQAAVNRTDSNALAGHPSQGMFQFIQSTFDWLSGLAQKANPAAWHGVTRSIDNPQAQALTASYAITHGHTGDWTTYTHAQAQAKAHPIAESVGNGIITGVNGTVNTALEIAGGLIGTPYKWGGTTPGAGFDCSGFVQYVFAKAGVQLPRTSQQQAAAGTVVSQGQDQPGDLVFFNEPGEGPNSHVGIDIGNGEMIDAPHTGSTVQVQPIGPGATYEQVPGVMYGGASLVTAGLNANPFDLFGVPGTVHDAATAVPDAISSAGSAISNAFTSATSWIGKELITGTLIGASTLIGGALIVVGVMSALGGRSPGEVAGQAAQTAAKTGVEAAVA